MSIRIVTAAVLLAALPVSAFPAAQESASAILARVRTATLARPLSSVQSVESRGSLVAVGLHAQATEIDDVVRERFVQRTTGGGFLGGANGFDGTTSWNQTRAGIVFVDASEATHFQNVDQAYMQAFAYLRPDLGGASATFTGERHVSGSAYDIVELTPPGGTALDLWIDEATNRIAKIEGRIGLVTSTTTYSDYRNVEGIWIPFHSTNMDSNGNGSEITLASAMLNVPGVDAAMRIPASDAHDFSISGGDSTTTPIRIVNNHIYAQVYIDGKGPYTFIFDTGGDNIVSPAVAAAVRERSTGGIRVTGVGASSEGAQFTHVASMRIGNATLRDQDFIVLPIDQGFGVAEGMHIDGMFGPAVPWRFLTAIDYLHQTLTLSLEGRVRPAGAAVPFAFNSTIPTVPVTIDGIATRADLDTGNRGQLFLTTPFLAAHPSLAAKATTPNGVTGFGVGGPSYGRLGRIATVQIGPYALHGVVGDFGTQTTGATADPFTSANLGGGTWNRFTLTLDYPHQRIYLAPNARYGTPFENDRSGLFIIAYHGGVMVLDARPGTPAANAGLKKGDMIAQVDGRSASSYTLAQLRELLSQAPGTIVHLHVRSGSSERDVTLTLAQYV